MIINPYIFMYSNNFGKNVDKNVDKSYPASAS